MEKVQLRKRTIKYLIILAVAFFLEVVVGNWSAIRMIDAEEIVLAENVTVGETLSGGDETAQNASNKMLRTDGAGTYYTECCAVDADIKNVHVNMHVNNGDTGQAFVILTDEGDKYEYATPEFTICNDVPDTGYSNIYPFGRVHTIQVAVKLADGCSAEIDSISINSPKAVDIKWIRLTVICLILLCGYWVFTNSGLHRIYYTESCRWQKIVTVMVILALLLLGRFLTTEDPVLVHSPWPHHRQYQELAHSLAGGKVELAGQIVDAALLQSENPYDTIALQVEGVPYAMDYAYYDGHYYEYFGIVPEILFYYPYYQLTGNDLPNHLVIFMEYIIFVVGAYLAVRGLTKRYINSIPYFFYMGIYVGTVLLANFVYLVWRTDIYNVPIMGAVAFTFTGIGLWLHALLSEKKSYRILLLAGGSLSMALVAGCRPQFLILSGLAVFLFLFEKGFQDRRLFTRESLGETIAFVVPYLCVAALVGWYNYARFGSPFDFGATYSLTTNDMNHRGFNFERLFRSLYCFWLQPAVINTDFPFLYPAWVDGDYMGKFLSEFLYGGILTANAFFVSIWLWMLGGSKKRSVGTERRERSDGSAEKKGRGVSEKAANAPRIIILYLLLSAIVISAFDANAAGVIYRYTCDFAPALVLAAAFIWLLYLDRGADRIEYVLVSRLLYICLIGSLFYTLFSFCAGGNNVCLENDNARLFYQIAGYFRL